MKDIPTWIQVGIALVLLGTAIVAFNVHLQDGVEKNHAGLERLHQEVGEVDDIVRDNQQRLAHIEAILSGVSVAKQTGGDVVE